jgi:hypothetical protein
MRTALVIMLTLMVTAPCLALDPGNHPTVSKPGTSVVPPPADPTVIRQGGDTIVDAIVLDLPAVDVSGTTAGFTDNYDEACPYQGSTSPDVVYAFTSDADIVVDIDLCGSAYDTKVYVYDQDLNLVACNDDFYSSGDPCGTYVSKIEQMPVIAGVTYVVVIDGFGGAFGDYLLNISEFVPCQLDCPAGAQLEGEPPLTVGYVDTYNGGCNTDPENPPFQPLYYSVFCGKSGYYLSGVDTFRDTDWFIMTIPDSGVLEVLGDAEQPTYMFELGPQDCGAVMVVQSVPFGPCLEGLITIVGVPGSLVWFWVGPQDFTSPDGSDVYEYEYVLIHWGIIDEVEQHSLSEVKALFR